MEATRIGVLGLIGLGILIGRAEAGVGYIHDITTPDLCKVATVATPVTRGSGGSPQIYQVQCFKDGSSVYTNYSSEDQLGAAGISAGTYSGSALSTEYQKLRNVVGFPNPALFSMAKASGNGVFQLAPENVKLSDVLYEYQGKKYVKGPLYDRLQGSIVQGNNVLFDCDDSSGSDTVAPVKTEWNKCSLEKTSKTSNFLCQKTAHCKTLTLADLSSTTAVAASYPDVDLPMTCLGAYSGPLKDGYDKYQDEKHDCDFVDVRSCADDDRVADVDNTSKTYNQGTSSDVAGGAKKSSSEAK
jgi:hypothetical protein